jgi:hypothetical protein
MAILLAYPYDPPHTQEIALRNPELGNGEQLNLKTMVKQNMYGNIYTNKKTPTNSKLVLTFRTLERSEVEALKQFYTNWIGYVIEYTQWDSIRWQCRIANDSLVVTTNIDNCSYDAVLELIGG